MDKKPSTTSTDSTSASDPETPVSSAEHQKTVDELNRVKQRNRSRPILVVLLTLLLVGLGAAAAWYIMNNTDPEDDPVTSISQDEVAERTRPDASWAIEQVKQVFEGDSTNIERPLLGIQTAGANFYTDVYDMDAYTGLRGDVAANDVAVTVAEIGKSLTDAEFDEQISDFNTDNSYSARYYGAEAACVVSAVGSANTPSAAHDVQVACVDMSTVEDLADRQKPLGDAASDVVSADKNTALYGEPAIETSKTDGYRIATQRFGVANRPAGMGKLHLYQTVSGDWVYVSTTGDSASDGLPCDVFTGQARAAYAGQPCYNGMTESRVN